MYWVDTTDIAKVVNINISLGLMLQLLHVSVPICCKSVSVYIIQMHTGSYSLTVFMGVVALRGADSGVTQLPQILSESFD